MVISVPRTDAKVAYQLRTSPQRYLGTWKVAGSIPCTEHVKPSGRMDLPSTKEKRK